MSSCNLRVLKVKSLKSANFAGMPSSRLVEPVVARVRREVRPEPLVAHPLVANSQSLQDTFPCEWQVFEPEWNNETGKQTKSLWR